MIDEAQTGLPPPPPGWYLTRDLVSALERATLARVARVAAARRVSMRAAAVGVLAELEADASVARDAVP